jgi:hypothetical protein
VNVLLAIGSLALTVTVSGSVVGWRTEPGSKTTAITLVDYGDDPRPRLVDYVDAIKVLLVDFSDADTLWDYPGTGTPSTASKPSAPA